MRAMRVGGDDGELRPWHCIYVSSIESRLILNGVQDALSNERRCAAAMILMGHSFYEVLLLFFITLEPGVD